MASYEQAEEYLKDYLSGNLQAQLERRRLELIYPPKNSSAKDLRQKEPDPRADSMRRPDKLENEVISYVDDSTYVYLKSKIRVLDEYMELLRKTNKVTYRILTLFYYHDLPWINVADAVCLSESGCRKRRVKAVKELQLRL